jgi:hypothetical protein
MTQPIVILIGVTDDVAAHIDDRFETTRYTQRENYVGRLADDNAAFILINADSEPAWRFFTTTPKSSPATRRIPIVVVSADAEIRAEALIAGANTTLAPDEVPQKLSDLLNEMARVVEPEIADEMLRQCGESLPPEALHAIELFNAGEFYKQHDTFEALWMAEDGPARDLYRAILQVGVSYYQVQRGNQRGALKMLLRSLQWLALLPDECQGVDVARLKTDAAAARAELERVGVDGIEDFDKSLLKPVQMMNNAN